MLFSWAVERNLMRRHINDPAEFIGADKFLCAGNGLSDGKNECSTVGIAAAAGAPIIIGNADQLELLVPHIGAGNNEEPGSIRRTVDMHCLNLSVDTLFLFGQMVKVHLYRWGEGLDDIFQGVAVDPV